MAIYGSGRCWRFTIDRNKFLLSHACCRDFARVGIMSRSPWVHVTHGVKFTKIMKFHKATVKKIVHGGWRNPWVHITRSIKITKSMRFGKAAINKLHMKTDETSLSTHN